jgi:hypothetical protein
MAKKDLGTVRDVAERIVEENKRYYSMELLQTVPYDLLGRNLNNENLFAVSLMVEKFMFIRMGYLGGILGYPQKEVFRVGGDLYDKLINLPNHDHLPPDQQKLIKEIKFLNNLALKVAHQ